MLNVKLLLAVDYYMVWFIGWRLMKPLNLLAAVLRGVQGLRKPQYIVYYYGGP